MRNLNHQRILRTLEIEFPHFPSIIQEEVNQLRQIYEEQDALEFLSKATYIQELLKQEGISLSLPL